MSTKVLDITHLNKVLTLLRKYHLSGKCYYEFGLSLGLSAETLDSIEHDHKGDVTACLRLCLSAWLRKADDVGERGGPTWETLIGALNDIKERSVAEQIEKEVFISVYDRSEAGLDSTNEEHAVEIFKRHKKLICQIRNPVSVARFLREGGVNITDDTLAGMEDFNNSLEERSSLLRCNVLKVVSGDFSMLKVFADVCRQTGNNDIYSAIMADYEPTFMSLVPRFQVQDLFKRTIEDVKEAIKNSYASDELLSKLNSFLRKRYVLSFTADATVSDQLHIVERECTPYNVTAFEELAKELDCPKACQYLRTYNDSVDASRAPCLDFQQLSQLNVYSEMETLVITIDCNSDDLKYTAQRKRLLKDLFPHLSANTVKWDYSDAKAIVCTFPPEYGTLLTKMVIENLEMCRSRGVTAIKIGFCQILGSEYYDEVYEGLVKKLTKDKDEEQHLLEKEKELQQLHQQLKEREAYLEKHDTSGSELRERLLTSQKQARAMRLENEQLLRFHLQNKAGLEEALLESQQERVLLQEKVSQQSVQLIDKKNTIQKLLRDIEELRLLTWPPSCDQPHNIQADDQNDRHSELVQKLKEKIKFLEERVSSLQKMKPEDSECIII